MILKIIYKIVSDIRCREILNDINPIKYLKILIHDETRQVQSQSQMSMRGIIIPLLHWFIFNLCLILNKFVIIYSLKFM